MRHEHEEGIRQANLLLRALDALERVRKQNDQRHLRLLGWLAIASAGGAKAWDWVGRNRASVTTGATMAVAGAAAGGTIACAAIGSDSPERAQQRPAIAAPPPPAATTAPARAPQKPSTAPAPTPRPIEIPSRPSDRPTTVVTRTAPPRVVTRPPASRPPSRKPPSTRPPSQSGTPPATTEDDDTGLVCQLLGEILDC